MPGDQKEGSEVEAAACSVLLVTSIAGFLRDRILYLMYRDVFKICYKKMQKYMLFAAPRPSQGLPKAENNMPDTLRRSPAGRAKKHVLPE